MMAPLLLGLLACALTPSDSGGAGPAGTRPSLGPDGLTWALPLGATAPLLLTNLALGLWAMSRARSRREIAIIIARHDAIHGPPPPERLARPSWEPWNPRWNEVVGAGFMLLWLVWRWDRDGPPKQDLLTAALAICVFLAAIALFEFVSYRRPLLKAALILAAVTWAGYSNSDPFKLRYPGLERFAPDGVEGPVAVETRTKAVASQQVLRVDRSAAEGYRLPGRSSGGAPLPARTAPDRLRDTAPHGDGGTRA